MRQWPTYALEAVASVVAPTLRRRPNASEIASALDRLDQPVTARLSELAVRWKVRPAALKMQLRRAGVAKASRRGPRGEGIYKLDDVEKVMGKENEENDN